MGQRAETSLLDFVPYNSPQYDSPRHLKPFVDAIESTLSSEVRLVISSPPQHAKTETTLHGLVWTIRRRPGRRNAYVSYEAERAEAMGLRCLRLAQSAGIDADGTRRSWTSTDGSQLMSTGIGGPLTGYPVDGLLIVDDPVKNRIEAESATYRDRTDDWFRDVAMTRVHPGASVIVIQTRWHPDDLAGRLIARGWPHINLKAIGDDGLPLWPSKRPLRWLEERRKELGEYSWSSLYQGEPRSRGGRVFGDVTLCESIPKTAFRVYVGVDFAYTSKTYSDYSVAVVLADCGDRFYVLEVVRRQVQAPAFAQDLKNISVRYPGAKFISHVSGMEQGIIDLVKAQTGVTVNAIIAKADKFTRAQPVAAAWNDHRVLVPRGAPWADAFISEVASFTGVDDPHDDQVDALASAHSDKAGPLKARIEIS